MTKSFKKIIIAGTLLILFLGALAAIYFLLINKPKKLTTPSVVLTEDVVSWHSVDYATGYQIEVNGVINNLGSTVLNYTLKDGESFKVKALGDGKKYSDSEWSTIVQYQVTTKKFTITWKNGDEILEVDTDVVEGTMPTYDGVTPVKVADENYTYEFNGWTPEVLTATKDAIYTATFKAIPITYTITWKNGDEVLEVDNDVTQGVIPSYDGETPVKATDDNFIYVFEGWSPEIETVSSDFVYTAIFKQIPNDFTIIWANGEKELEKDEHLKYGDIPEYNGQEPIKEATEKYEYIFDGWEPSVNQVTESVTYKAKFKEVLRKYTVTFYDENGTTVLGTIEVDYGTTAIYPNETPTKDIFEGYYYLFDNWVTAVGGNTIDDLSNVVSNRNVYASFKEFIRTVTVYVVSNNSEFGTVSLSKLEDIPYGTLIKNHGDFISIGEHSISALINEKNAQYTYSFVEWNHEEKVGNDTVITAVFAATINEYSITWKNGNEILSTQENIPYGTIPTYQGSLPTKEYAGEGKYVFSGWNPEITKVTGNQIYEAKFDFVLNQYTVTFYDENGITVLGSVSVDYGTEAKYPYANPLKNPTKDYIYEFDKWVNQINSKEEADLSKITKDIKVYASYVAKPRVYEVKFVDWDGSVIETQSVNYGESATLPSDPERENYRFKGWIGNYTDIAKDEIVSASYIGQYSIRFVDINNLTVKELYCDCGYNPEFEVPELELNDYFFNGWYEIKTNRNINSFNFRASSIGDLWIFKPLYTKLHTITFIDYDGNYIDEIKVLDGKKINTTDFPEIPNREGYNSKWDKEILNTIISENKIYTPIYEAIKYNVIFKINENNEILDVVHYGSFITLPTIDLYKFKTNDMKLYGFSHWAYENGEEVIELEVDNNSTGIYQNKLINIYQDVTLYPVYSTKVEKPVIAINIKDTTMTMSFYVPEDILLYSINFSMTWDESAGIDSTKILSYTNLNKNECDKKFCTVPEKDTWLICNSKTKTLNFVWNCGNGHNLATTETLITINFEIPNTSIIIDKEDFIINNSSCVYGKLTDNITGLEPKDILVWFY